MSKKSIRRANPEIADKLEDLWGTVHFEPYILGVIAIHNSDPLGFSTELYNELVGLLDLHRDLD